MRHCVLFFQHVQGYGHFVFASRLGSLSTVFTWLRSRACAGMQGLGVLALVVVAPCGFAAHVAPEEAVLSSLAIAANDASCEICSVPGARAPTTYPPQNQSPWTPPPEPLHPSHPTGYPSKKPSFFFFLYALETSKIRRKLRNLLRPWGPCPYHLPPRKQSPWTPPPEPLYPPPSHRVSFKKIIFLLFVRVRNLLRPWGPCPYHLFFPAPKPLDPPSRALVPSPTPQGILQKKSFFFFLYALERSKIRRKLPLLWNCHPAPTPTPNPFLQPRPLVYRPVHQASSGG